MILHPVSLFYVVVVITSTITVADPGVPRRSPDVSDVTGQHGLDHPSVVIDLPELECECKFSRRARWMYKHFAGGHIPEVTSNLSSLHQNFSSPDRKQGGAANSSQASACREKGEVYWMVSVRGLITGFVYEVLFEYEWPAAGEENTHHWSTVFTPSTSAYTVRHPLQRFQTTQVSTVSKTVTSVWDAYIPTSEPFFVEVTVRDMHPGLTSEEALIGTRRLNSAVNTVRVQCTDIESGTRTTSATPPPSTSQSVTPPHSTKVPDGTFIGQGNKLDEYESPALVTPQSPASALGIKQQHQNDSGAVPTHLTHADSDADTAGQVWGGHVLGEGQGMGHGLDHPAVFIDLPELECECTYSHAATTSHEEQGGAASSSEASACREEGKVYWNVSVRGLVAGFVYEVHFSLEWSGETAHHWNTIFTPSTSLYTARLPLSERIQKTRAFNMDTSVWDAHILQEESFFVEVTVRDMHLGLTREEALIGTRRINSDVNAVRVQCSDLKSGERTKVPDATFVGQVNKLPECDARATKTRPACRIISPVPGAAFGPSSPIVQKGYVKVQGHMYDFSRGETFDLHFTAFLAQLGDDGLNHDVFQKAHTITDGNDLRFEVSVRYPAPGRYTFVFRWTHREKDGSSPSVGICKADFELLAAEVPTDAESLFIPLRSLPVSSGGGDPCVDEFHCSDEYRELLYPSEGTMERLDQISAEQVLAETRMCEPDCRKEDELLTVILRVYSRPGMFQESLEAIINSNAPILRVWVIVNGGSPHIDFFRDHTEAAKGKLPAGMSLDFFTNTVNVGYYEAFLRALLTDTPYVAIIDDDLLIGKDFFRVALHALRTWGFYGVIAARGKRLVQDSHCSPFVLQDNTYGPDSESSRNRGGVIDIPFSLYLARASVFRVVFRDAPFSWKTGEDINFGAAVRRHAKLRVMVIAPGEMPSASPDTIFRQHVNATWVDLSPDEQWPKESFHTSPYPGLTGMGGGAGGVVTKAPLNAFLRRRVQYSLWQRGWPVYHTARPRRAACGGTRRLMMATTLAHARVFREAGLVDLDQCGVILNSRDEAGGNEMRSADAAELLSELGLENSDVFDSRVFDLKIQNDDFVMSYPRLFSVYVEALQSVLEATHATTLLIVADGSVTSAAAATVCGLMGVQIEPVNVAHGDSLASRLFATCFHAQPERASPQ